MAKRGVGSSSGAIFGDESGDIGAEITEGSEEDETVDGLVEASAEEEGSEDEEDAEQGSNRADSFGDLNGVDLAWSESGDHDGGGVLRLGRISNEELLLSIGVCQVGGVQGDGAVMKAYG